MILIYQQIQLSYSNNNAFRGTYFFWRKDLTPALSKGEGVKATLTKKLDRSPIEHSMVLAHLQLGFSPQTVFWLRRFSIVSLVFFSLPFGAGIEE